MKTHFVHFPHFDQPGVHICAIITTWKLRPRYLHSITHHTTHVPRRCKLPHLRPFPSVPRDKRRMPCRTVTPLPHSSDNSSTNFGSKTSPIYQDLHATRGSLSPLFLKEKRKLHFPSFSSFFLFSLLPLLYVRYLYKHGPRSSL
jgi:hypothetical protein